MRNRVTSLVGNAAPQATMTTASEYHDVSQANRKTHYALPPLASHCQSYRDGPSQWRCGSGRARRPRVRVAGTRRPRAAACVASESGCHRRSRVGAAAASAAALRLTAWAAARATRNHLPARAAGAVCGPGGLEPPSHGLSPSRREPAAA